MTLDDDEPEWIRTRVGDQMTVVAHDLFVDVHYEIADEMRARGLTGQALDEAIVAARPYRLAQRLGVMVLH